MPLSLSETLPDGISCRAGYREVTDDKERELLRNRFRLPKRKRERLRSYYPRVGCEGLDMSFVMSGQLMTCPWNPSG